MNSVTGRIKEVKQPRGGYIKPSQFKEIKLEDNKSLNEKENISPSIIGMTIDYLTRFMMGADIEDAFEISLTGARLAYPGAVNEIYHYLSQIKGIDEVSIINACKCVTFDVWYRNHMAAMMAKSAKDTCPDKDTIQNIQIMVKRSIAFFEKYGPITVDGFTFEPDGYTSTVNTGDGDFLTADTLWDFKVSKKKPTSQHTLQLLMYWIMGQHSENNIFDNIRYIGIFNPRLNTVYTYEIKNVPEAIIEEVETKVIGYY